MQAKTFHDLISAVKQGDAADARALLKKGARPNVLGHSLRRGEGCISALAIAIERADAGIVEVLFLHGANPHGIGHVYSAPAAVGARTSALHFLCGIPMLASPWCAIAERLLAHGTAIDARNRAGLTALQLCLESGQDERRSFLVDWAGPALQALHGWIAIGARPSAGLLAAHRPSTPIGNALRMYRIDAAVAFGDQLLVWHVLESADDKGDADCQATGARLELDAGHPDMEEVLDLWLASGFGDEV